MQTQVGPNPGQECGCNAHPENARFHCYVQRFLAPLVVLTGPCSPRWVRLGSNFGGSYPTEASCVILA